MTSIVDSDIRKLMDKYATISSAFSLFRFHLRVGTRIALQVFAPFIAIMFALFYFFRPDFFLLLSNILFSFSGYTTSGVFTAAICIFTSRIASFRVCLGLNGWIRHLPLDAVTIRRTAQAAIFVAILPILISVSFLSSLSNIVLGENPFAYIVGTPLQGLSAALCVVSVKRNISTKFLAGFACILAGSGSLVFVLGSVFLILAADLSAGSFSPQRKKYGFFLRSKGLFFMAVLTWRSLRYRLFLPYILSLFCLCLTYMFLSNNKLDPQISTKVFFLGGGSSIVFSLALLSNMIAVRRPPWPWSRSLPWSAQKRILLDAGFLFSHSIPIIVVLILWKGEILFPLLTGLPALVLYTTGKIRQASGDRFGPGGKIFLVGMFGSFSISLFPWIFLVFPAIVPIVLKFSSEQDKKHKISRWIKQKHRAAGDSISWSE